jgi:SAM-dependent methyltransferase
VRPCDVWACGEPYEHYVGRWSRLVAREFLQWVDVPRGRRWLDVGCGTGALTETVLVLTAPATVVGIDPSQAFVAYARDTVVDERARFLVGDAMDLPFEDEDFDAVVSALVLNFVADPGAAVSEMARVTAAAGVVAAYVWDYASGMQLIRHFWDAAGALDPAALELDEGQRFGGALPDALEQVFCGAGLADVETRAIDVQTRFHDFDDYWSPFLGGQGPAPSYAASLTEERRTALRERLRATVPTRADGSIELTARAWAVRGVRR